MNISFPKRRDVIEFVTEADNIFLESMPDIRKFTRLALPGEVDGIILPLTKRYVVQNDQGAQYKILVPPPGVGFPQENGTAPNLWTNQAIFNGLLLASGGLENLFYRSMKITSFKQDVPFADKQQVNMVGNSIPDTVVYRNAEQLPGRLWWKIEGGGLEVFPLACEPMEIGLNNIMFFNSYNVDFICEPVLL
ncbi:MAG: hypothetical protein QG591_2572 [Planctomycetota bacterium]|nr:hypothetical protein [Planctomycetota bacterium]